MSLLITCASCRRHLRSDAHVCPFCAAPVAQPSPASAERATIARGTKRATLFAMGISLAASACEADNSVPIYGAPAPPIPPGTAGRANAGAAGTAGTAGTGGSAGTAGAAGNAGTQDEPADASAPRDAATDAGDAATDAGDAAP